MAAEKEYAAANKEVKGSVQLTGKESSQANADTYRHTLTTHWVYSSQPRKSR